MEQADAGFAIAVRGAPVDHPLIKAGAVVVKDKDTDMMVVRYEGDDNLKHFYPENTSGLDILGVMSGLSWIREEKRPGGME